MLASPSFTSAGEENVFLTKTRNVTAVPAAGGMLPGVKMTKPAFGSSVSPLSLHQYSLFFHTFDHFLSQRRCRLLMAVLHPQALHLQLTSTVNNHIITWCNRVMLQLPAIFSILHWCLLRLAASICSQMLGNCLIHVSLLNVDGK